MTSLVPGIFVQHSRGKMLVATRSLVDGRRESERASLIETSCLESVLMRTSVRERIMVPFGGDNRAGDGRFAMK